MDYDQTDDISNVLLEDYEVAEAGKFPKFMKLLKHLNECISVRGTSNHLEKQHDEAKGKLKVAKCSYLQNTTIYAEIKEMHLEFCIQKLEEKFSDESIKFHDKVHDILVQSEVKQKLACLQLKEAGPNKCKYGLLGLDLYEKSSPKQNLTADEVKRLHMALHQRLQTRCTDFAKFYDNLMNARKDPNYLFLNEKLSTAQCHFFSSTIESKKQELETKRKKLELAKIKKQQLILKYYITLKDATRAMMELGEICLSNNRDFRRSTVLKLNSELILIKMRQYLDEAIAKSEADKIVTERRLATYESVGSQFHLLLNEYVGVMTQIDNRASFLKTWTECNTDKE